MRGPLDFAETLKLRFLCRWPEPARKKKEYTTVREEEEVDAQMCPCGKAIESRTHIVGECEMYIKGERDVLEYEMREKQTNVIPKYGGVWYAR